MRVLFDFFINIARWACYRSAKALTGFILGYAHFKEEELEAAVFKLKEALDQTLS